MSLFSKYFKPKRGYSSLIAMYCSVIILNLALGYFSFQRDTLRLHAEDIKGLIRKTYQSNALLFFWSNSADFIDQGLTEWKGHWQNEPCKITYISKTTDHMSVEGLTVLAVNHPEWQMLVGSRVSTETRVLYLQGRVE